MGGSEEVSGGKEMDEGTEQQEEGAMPVHPRLVYSGYKCSLTSKHSVFSA